MLMSFLALFTAIASVQVLLVVKLADFITADGRGTQAIDSDVGGVRTA